MLIRFCAALSLVFSAYAAHAVTIVLADGPPLIFVQIGSGGATIDQVSFNVAVANVGNGTPVAGAPVILVAVAARATIGGSRTAQLTANSVVPLVNGAATLPFASISWTASDADIPSGTFNGTAAQLLVQFQNSRLLFSNHTFSYANTLVLQAGTFTGRITYTVTMP